MNGPDHHRDAETLLRTADAAALRAGEAGAEDDPLAGVPELVSAVMLVLAGQVHATLALAAALEGLSYPLRTIAPDGGS